MAKVVLYDLDGDNISLSFKSEFPYSNNVFEYEALVIGLVSALQWEFENSNYRETLSSSSSRVESSPLKENAPTFKELSSKGLSKLLRAFNSSTPLDRTTKCRCASDLDFQGQSS